jgi:hypothetical protein
MTDHGEFECGKCGTPCMVDGEFPKFFAWCDTCDDYAAGFGADELNQYAANRVDNPPERERL